MYDITKMWWSAILLESEAVFSVFPTFDDRLQRLPLLISGYAGSGVD
jgi:hypothetical protein